MEKNTALNQREITKEGIVQVRVAKQILGDDGAVESSQYHRFMLMPGADLVQCKKTVDASLAQLKYPPMSDTDWNKIVSLCALEWTPEVVAAYMASLPPEVTQQEEA